MFTDLRVSGITSAETTFTLPRELIKLQRLEVTQSVFELHETLILLGACQDLQHLTLDSAYRTVLREDSTRLFASLCRFRTTLRSLSLDWRESRELQERVTRAPRIFPNILSWSPPGFPSSGSITSLRGYIPRDCSTYVHHISTSACTRRPPSRSASYTLETLHAAIIRRREY
jgi:hypothetical protein